MSDPRLMHAEFLVEALIQDDLDHLLKVIVDRLPDLLWPGATCSVFLWENREHRFVLKATNNSRLEPEINAGGYLRGEGLTGWVGTYGIPLFLQNAKDNASLERFARPELGIPPPIWTGKVLEGESIACMAVPILPSASTPPLGVIRLAPSVSDSGLPEQKQEKLFERIGQVVAGAFQKAQLDALMYSMLTRVKNFEVELLQGLLNYLSVVCRSFSTHVRLHDLARDTWHVLAVSESPFSSVVARSKGSGDGHLIEPILNKEVPYHLDNEVQANEQYQSTLSAARVDNPPYARYLEQIGAGLIVPIRESEDGPVIGMLNLHRFPGDSFSEMREIVTIVAFTHVIRRVVTGISGSDLRRGEEALTSIDNQDYWNRRKVSEEIVRAALEITNADLAILRLVDEVTGRLSLVAQKGREGVQHDGLIPVDRVIGQSGTGAAVKENEAVLVPDTEVDDVYQDEIAEARSNGNEEHALFLSWIRSLIAAPLRAPDGPFGALALVSHTSGQFGPRELLRAQGLAKEAAYRLYFSRVKSEFVTRASHELSKPLNRIIPAAQLLLKCEHGDLNDTQLKFADYICSNSKHLLRLASDLLDIDLLRAGKLTLSAARIDLRFEVETAIDRVSAVAEQHDIKVQHRIEDGIQYIWADAAKLGRVIDNLLDNALKFTPDGGSIDLELRLLTETPNAQHSTEGVHRLDEGTEVSWLQFSVKDTGCGINESDLGRIFAPFEKASVTSTRAPQGSGIGLSLAQSFIELHGGRIWASSPGPNLGSTVTFTIPVDGPVRARGSSSTNNATRPES